MSDNIIQTKLILPGSQLENYNLSDVNDKYFIYCSTSSVFIFNKSDLKLRCILGDNPDKNISFITLSQSKTEELLAVCHYKEILIYNLSTNKLSYSFPFDGLKLMKFNKISNLLLLNNKGELFLSTKDIQEKNNINKIKIEDGLCTYFKWYPFNDNDFAYSTDKNKIYYISLNNNNEKNKVKEKYIHIKDEENFYVSFMEFYDLDENYKFLLVGTTNSKIYLLDFINYEITNKFVKYGKTPIQYLFWLNSQPGSFISINEKVGRFIKWNVSRQNYILVGKLSEHNLISCVKYDNDSNFLIMNVSGEVSIVNIINNKLLFQIKDRHYQCIYDLKINPNNDDLFITASFDGNIKLYSIKNKYSLVYNFNTNTNLNNLKTISSSEENNASISKLGGAYNLKFNSNKCHVICLKWAPNHPNLFASGDSLLNLRIFDISIQKQIISYKCLVKNQDNNKTDNNKNIIIHGIDWNEKDNIIVGANIFIFLFSFVINDDNNDNSKSKYSLILINEIKIESLVYNLIFEPNNEHIITPCENGNIYFFNTTRDKLGKIIDINPSPSQEINGHSKSVYQVIFNNSNTILASCSDDMKIGIYEMEKIKSTPRSKLTSTMTKFLTGQENPIRQILFLNDDTLISGSLRGSICIWNIEKCQLIYKLLENQSDVYGLSASKKNPFLFAAGSRDGTIRFWNLNYKFNLNKLFELDKNNKNEIQKFLEQYFYEEDYNNFMNLLFNSNKEKELFDKIIKKEEYIKNEYSKYNLNKNDLGIKNKIDFSLSQSNKEEIINKLIKESIIIGSWKLCCELCILINKWEEAICFAPKVSLEYWKSLMNKYEEYVNSEDYIKNKNGINNYKYNIDESKLIGLLNDNNYKLIIDSFIKQKDLQNALMIWLVKKSQKKNDKNQELLKKNENDLINVELESNFASNLNENDKTITYINLKTDLNKDKNISKLFDEIALIQLKEGNRFKAIINYMYLENKFMLFKTIFKTYFVELGYLLCNFEVKENEQYLKEINDYFLIFLYEKYKKKFSQNTISLLINKLYDDDFKNILNFKFLKKFPSSVLKINSNETKSKLFEIVDKNDKQLYINYINKNNEECIIKLINLFLDKDNKVQINESEINDISLKLSEYQKFLILLKIKDEEIDSDIKKDIILSVMFLECLNLNYKSLICLIIEYFISKNIIDINKENKNIILIFIFNFVHYIQNNFKENEIVKEYKFNFIHSQKYKLISSFANNNSLNYDKFNKIRDLLHFNDFYKCENGEMKLFYLKSEIYPRKIKSDDNLSSFSNRNIKSNFIRLMSGNFASQSEFLEMSKFLSIY